MINLRIRVPLFLLFLTTAFGNLLAQEIESIQTDRPDLTESAFTVPAGYFQVEAGLLRTTFNSESSLNFLPTILIKYGISSNFELRVNTDLAFYSQDGISEGLVIPLSVGIKVAISDEKGVIPKTAFIGHLKIPTGGTGELSLIYVAPSFRFTMQHSLSKRISLGYNLGIEWSGITAEPIFIYTITSGMSLSNKFGAYLEIFGFAPQFNKAEHSLDAGITYLFNNNRQADVSFGFGLTPNAPDYLISAGYSFRVNTR